MPMDHQGWRLGAGHEGFCVCVPCVALSGNGVNQLAVGRPKVPVAAVPPARQATPKAAAD